MGNLEDMNSDTLLFVLGIAGAIIFLLLTILGFFTSRLVTDLRRAIEDIGKNKGNIELIKQQQENDIRRVEQMTQMELKVMSEKVGQLSDNVKLFMEHVVKKDGKD